MNIKVPVSWLREYLKTDAAAKTIASSLTTSGPSVERIEKIAGDYIFDVEVTSNRPDAFSVFGLAREANAILNNENLKSTLVEPKGTHLNLEPDVTKTTELDVIIKDPSLCPRFTAIVIDNVKIKPSPAYIKNRLQAAGIRAINNIVDISNYIMLELGQPMHTFDFDKIKGAKMTLRESQEGEKIKTLDEKIRTLPKGAIVIEDAERLIDLCGIMGGTNSQISANSKKVVLFVQAYDPTRIRKTTQHLAFRTEAASRFEKGVDLEGILPALSRAVYLAKETAGARVASELIDIYPQKHKPQTITLNFKRLKDYLGVDIPEEKSIKILENLGIKTKSSAQLITASPPSWRSRDLESEEDLIEEIARIYGYHKLPSTLPQGSPPNQLDSDLAKVIDLKKALIYLGLTEIISYSIISKNYLKLTAVSEKEAVELQNPLTEEWQFMRPTTLVSLAAVVSQNQNIASDQKLFEVAKTYFFPPSSSQPSLSSSRMRGSDLPIQDLKLAVAIQNGDFYQIKGVVENIFEILSREVKFQKPKTASLFQKNQSAEITIDNTLVGTLGLLNYQIADYFEIEKPVAACELNLTTIYQLPTTKLSYQPIAKYPPIIEDLSAFFNKKTQIATIISTVKDAGSPLLKRIDIIDIFEDEKIGKRKKSVTLRLTYQKSDSTPLANEVFQTRAKIISNLEKNLKAQVRR